MTYLGRRYAQALYDTGVSEADLKETVAMVINTPTLFDAFVSPVIRPKEKMALLEALPDLCKFPALFRFFKLLIETHRMSLLPDIIAEFHTLALDATNTAECVVTCVHILSDEQQNKIKQMLCRIHNMSEVILIFRMDPALLGGFTLQIEGITYDRSVRGRLIGLSRYLEEVNAT